MARPRKKQGITLSHKTFGTVSAIATLKTGHDEEALQCLTDKGTKLLLTAAQYWTSPAEEVDAAYRTLRFAELEKRAKKQKREQELDQKAAEKAGVYIEKKILGLSYGNATLEDYDNDDAESSLGSQLSNRGMHVESLFPEGFAVADELEF